MKMKKKVFKIGAIVLATVVAVATIALIVINNDFDRLVNNASKNKTEYVINADYDDATHTITATEFVNYINLSEDNLNRVLFHLYPVAFKENSSITPYTALTEARCFPNGKSYSDFKITSLKIDDSESSVILNGSNRDILEVPLLRTIGKKERASVEINFTLSLPNCTHRMGWFENNVNLGNWFPIVCEYLGNDEWDMTPYYATGDPFNSSIANFNVSITAPSEFIIASSGELINVSENAGRKTYQIEGKAIRDFAAVLSKDAKLLTDRVGNTMVNYYTGPNEENSENHLKLACEAVFTFNDLFGDYPYRTLSIINTPFMQGGMEYPNLIMASSLITDDTEYQKVIVHEIAHQWWYGVVGNDEVHDAWFDEGLSEFSTFVFFDKNPKYGTNLETLISDAVAGYNLYLEVFNAINISVNREMNLAVNEYSSEYEYTYMVYVKGAIMFNAIKEKIGDKAFFRGLKNLYKTNMFKKIDKEKFIESFKNNKEKVGEIVNKFLSGQSLFDA